jgi:hypothetical protein
VTDPEGAGEDALIGVRGLDCPPTVLILLLPCPSRVVKVLWLSSPLSPASKIGGGTKVVFLNGPIYDR